MTTQTRLRIIETQDQSPASPDMLRLGEKLLQLDLITRDQLQIALHEQRQSGTMLGTLLVQLGFLDEETLADILAARTGFASIDLKNTLIDPTLLARLPQAVAERCRAVPICLDEGRLDVAMADPYDVVAMDEIQRYFPRPLDLVPLVAPASDIADVLDHYGGFTASLDSILAEIESTTDTTKQTAEPTTPATVRLVNAILFDAVRGGASDIHLEPERHFVRLRYRIDGVMQQIRALHRAHWPSLSHRLKIMAGMNIADTRSLQDGRFHLQIGGAGIDFRAAVMPTAEGENIVIRILDHRRALVPMEKLGFDAATRDAVDLLLERPEGIVLVTGPTGCGKTTTLYSMLAKISSPDINIMTLEEPIEYELDLIRQTAVQEQQGLSFADGVRGILRQDPDVLFIGEIRDNDTAQMALRAAMTGHKIFSTLHCNDAFGALPRLYDLGLTPRMIASNMGGIIAQRLVRKLCPHCQGSRPATLEECRILRVGTEPLLLENTAPTTNNDGFAENQSPYIGPAFKTPLIGVAMGCDACHGQGTRGRIAVMEVLRITPALDDLIARDSPRSVLLQQARADGFRSMAEDGIAKVLAGDIALGDLRRAVDMTRGD